MSRHVSGQSLPDGQVGLVTLSLDIKDVLYVDEQPREEREDEVASRHIRCLLVELAGVSQKVEERRRLLGAVSQPVFGAFQLLADRSTLETSCLQLLAHDGDTGATGRDQIDEPLFLCFEFLQLFPESRFRRAILRQQFLQRAVNERLELVSVAVRNLLGGDHTRGLRLKVFDADRTHVAHPALLSSADEVFVDTAIAVMLGVYEAVDPPCVVAPRAVEQATQVVEVHPIAVPFSVALVEYVLHRQECLFAHERLVTPTVQPAFVSDHAGVVRVPQHYGESTLREWTGWPFATSDPGRGSRQQKKHPRYVQTQKGGVRQTVTIPSGTDFGAHKIEARGFIGGSAYAALTVTDGLAVTGFDSTSIAAIGIGASVLIIGGIAVVLVARRRETREQ